MREDKRQRCTTDARREHAIVKTDSMSRKRKGGTWNAICSVESVILEKEGTDSNEYLKKSGTLSSIMRVILAQGPC